METMHPAGRRTLPPVPRTKVEPTTDASRTTGADDHQSDSPTERFVVDLSTGEQHQVSATGTDPADDLSPTHVADHRHAPAAPEESAPDADVREGAPEAEDDAEDEVEADAEADADAEDGSDAEVEVEAEAGSDGDSEVEAVDDPQQFVARLRAAAGDFAGVAGAESAVVREAVPPARHRRALCRIVLRYADASEVDVTFLGQAGLPGAPSRHGFDRQILRWLKAGQRRDEAWLVTDPEATDGLAVDLSAWIAAA